MLNRHKSSQSFSRFIGLKSSFSSRDSGYVSGSIPEHDLSELESRLEQVRPSSQYSIQEGRETLASPSLGVDSPGNVPATSWLGSHRDTPGFRHSSHDISSPPASVGPSLHRALPISEGPRIPANPSRNTNQPSTHSTQAKSVNDGSFVQKYPTLPSEQSRRLSHGRNDSNYTPLKQQSASNKDQALPIEALQPASFPIEQARISSGNRPPSVPFLVAYNTTPANPPDPPAPAEQGFHASWYDDRITFNPRHVEKLSHGCYMDQTVAMPDTIVQKWNEAIKPQLDQDLQEMIKTVDAGRGMILSNVQLCMVGNKRGNLLRAEPTIVITCGTKECQRKIAKNLTRLKLHYLTEFSTAVKVRYQRSPAYWAASTVNSSAANLQFSDLQRLRVRYSGHGQTSCGLNLQVTVAEKGVERQVYATLGGVLCIGGRFYGMTTAHAFFAERNMRADQRECGNLPDWSSNYAKDEIVSRSDLYDGMICSFLGQVAKSDLVLESNEPLVSDWALLPLPKSCVLPNINRPNKLLTSIAPQTHLMAGEAHILHGVDSRYIGFLTQADVSFHTNRKVMHVREIVLDAPLPNGVSGSWVVRDHEVLGYVVAVSNKGLSCFMVSMERAFRDIESVLGEGVLMAWEPHEPVQRSARDIASRQSISGWNILTPLSELEDGVQPMSEKSKSIEGPNQVCRTPKLGTFGSRAPCRALSVSESTEKTDSSTEYSLMTLDKPVMSDLHNQTHAFYPKTDEPAAPEIRQKKHTFLRTVIRCCI